MGALGRSIALDLGSSQVRAAVEGKGVVCQSPAVVAVDRQTGQVLATGQAAAALLERAPGTAVAVRPLRGGIPTDLTAALALVRAALKEALGRHLVRPRLLLGVPAELSQVEERALVDLGLQAGARQVYLMEVPLAAARGAGLDPARSQGILLADVGEAVTDVAVLSLDRVVVGRTLPLGGQAWDEALVRWTRQTHGLLPGRRTARQVREAIGQVAETPEGTALSVKGRCLDSGLPRSLSLTPAETAAAFAPVAGQLLEGIRQVLAQAPPELARDVAETGLVLTGGGCLLRGLDRFLSQGLGLPVTRAEAPETCVIAGLEATLPHLHQRQDGPLDLARRRQVGPG